MLKYVEKTVKVITDILMFIVGIAVIFAIVNFVQLNIMDKGYANFFGYTVFEVASGSMEPVISKDDIIVVKLKKNDEDILNYKIDDIITYKLNNDYITHRIVKMEKDFLITKGDANNTSDNPIDNKVVLGKVIKIIPELGVWKKVIMTPKVLISVVITLFLFSFAFSITLNKNKKNKVEKIKSTDNKDDNIITSIPPTKDNSDDIEVL